MARATPGLKPKEWTRILLSHGCVLVREHGSHSNWQAPSGASIVTSYRSTGPSFKEVKMAANALGLSIEDLLAK